MLALGRLMASRTRENPQRLSTTPSPTSFVQAVAALSQPDLVVASQPIRLDDVAALTPQERSAFAARGTSCLAASASARALARRMLCEEGCAPCPILNGPSGEPIFPFGFVGSLAHDDAFALAAVGPRRAFRALGVDVEPTEPLPEELWSLVANATERRRLDGDFVLGRALFAAKEAIYKAFFSLDGTRLDYGDIDVRLDMGRAQIADGRLIALRHCIGQRIAVLAFLREQPKHDAEKLQDFSDNIMR